MSPGNSKKNKDVMANTIGAVVGLAGGSVAGGQAASQHHASIPFTPKPNEPNVPYTPQIPKDEIELVKKKKK